MATAAPPRANNTPDQSGNTRVPKPEPVLGSCAPVANARTEAGVVAGGAVGDEGEPASGKDGAGAGSGASAGAAGGGADDEDVSDGPGGAP